MNDYNKLMYKKLVYLLDYQTYEIPNGFIYFLDKKVTKEYIGTAITEFTIFAAAAFILDQKTNKWIKQVFSLPELTETEKLLYAES